MKKIIKTATFLFTIFISCNPLYAQQEENNIIFAEDVVAFRKFDSYTWKLLPIMLECGQKGLTEEECLCSNEAKDIVVIIEEINRLLANKPEWKGKEVVFKRNNGMETHMDFKKFEEKYKLIKSCQKSG